jgi:hypothetical protein
MRIGEQDMRFVTIEEEIRKNAGNPKEKIALVQTEIKKVGLSNFGQDDHTSTI